MTRLEFERRHRGWNQTELAYHAQITQSEVSLIETRRLAPTLHRASRLGQALGIAPEELLDEAAEDSRNDMRTAG